MIRVQIMIVFSFLILTTVGCDGQSSPTGNENGSFDFDNDLELVGTWVGVSSTNPEITDEAARITTLVLRADETQNTNIATGFGELPISLSGTWEIVGGKLIISILSTPQARPQPLQIPTRSEEIA